MALTGPIATFGSLVGGAAYTPGTYANVPLTGGTGTLAYADITVGGGGAVTAVTLHNPSSSSVIERTGKNYTVGDVLSATAASIGGTGASFTIAVASISRACENCYHGKIIPASGANLYGKRYCAFNAVDNLPNRSPLFWDSLIVPDDFYCSDGADAATGQSFSSGVTQLPGPDASTAWTPFTPTVTPVTGALTSVSANGRWIAVKGKTIHFVMAITVTTNGTGAGAVRASLPASPFNLGDMIGFMASAPRALVAYISGSLIYIYNVDGTYPGADGAIMQISGTYEAA